jgi:leucyl aminopeptidase (aminopeptidase T)
MKNVGIWLDKREAKIVWFVDGNLTMETIHSEVEEFHPVGGSRSRQKYGPQDVVQDSKYTEREKHQFKQYFDSLAEKVEDAGAIMVFGPAQTPDKLVDEWEKAHPKLRDKVLAVQKADSMTDNQVKAKVREFFEGIKA